jgi:hypothetical protein
MIEGAITDRRKPMSDLLKVKTGLRAGQKTETRYGYVDKLPDQGGLQGLWTIGDARILPPPAPLTILATARCGRGRVCSFSTTPVWALLRV